MTGMRHQCVPLHAVGSLYGRHQCCGSGSLLCSPTREGDPTQGADPGVGQEGGGLGPRGGDLHRTHRRKVAWQRELWGWIHAFAGQQGLGPWILPCAEEYLLLSPDIINFRDAATRTWIKPTVICSSLLPFDDKFVNDMKKLISRISKHPQNVRSVSYALEMEVRSDKLSKPNMAQ